MHRIQALLGADRPVTWLFAGDSITQGAVYTHGWRDYTQLFRERLGERARNEDVVVNTAAGGWSLRPLAARLEERVLRFRPDALFLLFGTNDASTGMEGLEAYRAAYADVVGRARQAGIEAIAVQTTVPLMPVDPAWLAAMDLPPGKVEGVRRRLACLPAYVEATRQLAAALDVPLVDHYAVWQQAGVRLGQLSEGLFHANEYGHRLLAHALLRACGLWDEASWTCRLFVPA
ncbi:MAG: SGNH/GDSL hydrolase family protein [Candidatus Latescibacterota bacterium]